MKLNIRSNRVSVVCGLILFLACGLTAAGAEYTWISGNNGDWTNAANWGGTVPKAGDTAYILNGTVSSDNNCLKSNQITINLGGGAAGQMAVLNTKDIGALTYVHAGGSIAINKDHCQLGEIYIEGGAYASTVNHYIKGGKLTLNSGSYSSQNLNLGHDLEGFFVQNGGTATVTGLASIGYGTKGTYTLTDGSATFNDFKVGVGGIGTFIQNGGTSTFNSSTTWISGGNDGTFTVTAGNTNFTKALAIGRTSGKTGILDLQGGTILFDMYHQEEDHSFTAYSVGIGSISGATGILKISGAAVVSFNGNDVHVGENGTGRIEQSGGTFTLKRGWLNIGEKGTGTYLLTGGELNTTKASMAVGRRNVGTMEISGTGVLNAGTLYVGMFPQKAGNSQLTLKTGGTANVNTLYIGGEGDNNAEAGTNPGTGSIVVEDGTLNVTGWTYIGSHSKNTADQGGTGILTLKGGTATMNRLIVGTKGTGANGTVNIEGGTNTFTVIRVSQTAGSVGKINISGGSNTISNAAYIGIYGGTDGTLEISGGNNTLAKVVVGYSDEYGDVGGSGVLNLTGGTGTTITTLQVGVGTGTNGTVNVTGGTHQIMKESYVGNNTGNNALILSGGTLTGPANDDFFIGNRDSDTRGTMTVKGTGTYSQTGIDGNFIVTAAKNAGDSNTVYLQDNGKMDLNWLSLGQHWEEHQGTAAVNVSSGTLTITNDLRIGHADRGEATISGGNITVKGRIQLDRANRGSTLNIIGSAATIKTQTLELAANGSVNFTADALTFTGNTPNAPLSTIAVTGNASVASNLNVDMTNYKYDSGIAFLDGTTTNLVTSGALTYTSASVKVTGPWLLNKNGNNLELRLDESKIGLIDLSADGTASGALGESGWLKMVGDGDLARIYVGDGQNMTQLVSWADEHFAGDSGVTVSSEGSFLTFANLDLGADNIGYLSWNLADYNQLYGTNATFQNVPEPATWALLLLGGMVFLFRKKRQ